MYQIGPMLHIESSENTSGKKGDFEKCQNGGRCLGVEVMFPVPKS